MVLVVAAIQIDLELVETAQAHPALAVVAVQTVEVALVALGQAARQPIVHAPMKMVHRISDAVPILAMVHVRLVAMAKAVVEHVRNAIHQIHPIEKNVVVVLGQQVQIGVAAGVHAGMILVRILVHHPVAAIAHLRVAGMNVVALAI